MQVTKLSTPSASHAAEILGHVITWINENMQQVLNNRAPGVIADLENRFILMGHSGAGQITTEFLNSSCSNVKLQILLDPVDGVDLFGTKKSYVITPGKMLPYATPVLVIAS
jgi:actin-like ATPase involved in cell morphogenesis